MVKHYINRSGQLFFFNEINRKMYADPNKIHKFSEEDIEKTPLLAALIAQGAVQEISEESVPKEVLTGVNLQKILKQSEIDMAPSAAIAEPLGQPPSTVSINPQGMSRLRDYAEPLSQPDIAVDPNHMSRYADTMQSLRGNHPEKTFTNAPNAVNYSQQAPSMPQGFEKTANLTSNVGYAQPQQMPQYPSSPPAVGNMATPTVNPESSTPEVWWCGPANDAGGYGRMNRECVEGLFSKGLKVQLDLFKIPDFRCAVPITDSMDEMMKTTVSETAPSIWAVMPQRFMPRAGRKIIYSMIETSEVQSTFLEKCKMANELWLPSKANVEAFERADTGELEIVHMPLGVDVDQYKPMELTDEQKSIFNIQPRSFVFLCLCGWSLRKGTDVLLKAYLQQFKAEDDVTLVIAARKDGSTNRDNIESIRNDIKKYINLYCPNPDNPPHIIHIGDVMAEETLPILYNMSNCFVLPSRGEGFGLPYCEAGACEVPVIATRCSGQLDFLTDENSFLMDVDGYEVAKQEIRCLSSYYENAPFAVIGKKGTEQLMEYMKFVVENNDKAKERAGILRKDLENNFTWKHLVDRVYDRIRSF